MPTLPVNLDAGTKSPDNVWVFRYSKHFFALSVCRRCSETFHRIPPYIGSRIRLIIGFRGFFTPFQRSFPPFSICFQLHFCFSDSWDKSALFQPFFHFFHTANRDNLPPPSYSPINTITWLREWVYHALNQLSTTTPKLHFRHTVQHIVCIADREPVAVFRPRQQAAEPYNTQQRAQ